MLRTSLVALLLIASGLISQAASGDELKPLKVWAVTGSQAGSEVDYVAERKEKATVYLFLRGDVWDRPIARYVKVLDTKLAEGIKEAPEAQAVAVWLSDDAAKGKEYLPKAQSSLNLSRTDWTVFEGQKAGPEGWNVDIADHLTVVVVRGGKEMARFKHKSTNDADVPEVIQALRK